jgi:hypothetical protein
MRRLHLARVAGGDGCAQTLTGHFRLGLAVLRITLLGIMRPSNPASRLEFIASASILLGARQVGAEEETENKGGRLALDGGRKAVGPAYA